MLDCHAHFFDPSRPEGLEWPPASAPFYGRKLIDEYRQEFGQSSGTAVIQIEASRRTTDDEWVANFAAQEPSIIGYIANLQPDQPGFLSRLDLHARNPKFKGLRLRPIELFDLASDQVHIVCEALEERCKVLELGAKDPDRLPAIFELARAHPDLSMILNHAGHPDLGTANGDAAWEEHLAANVVPRNLLWKLTPRLGGEVESHEARLARERCLKHIAAFVRPDNVLLGSNWPVTPASEWAAFRESVTRCIPFMEDDGSIMDAAMKAYSLT